MSEQQDDGWTDSDCEREMERVEANLKVEEIFRLGFNFGHSRAGFESRSDVAFKDWLNNRLELRASPVEPNICICPACSGSGGACDLCEGTGDVHDVPARRLSLVEPTPEPPKCVWRETASGEWTNGCACAHRPQGFYRTLNHLWSHCHFCGSPLTVER